MSDRDQIMTFYMFNHTTVTPFYNRSVDSVK